MTQLSRLAVDPRDPQVLLEEVQGIAGQAMQIDLAVIFLLEADRLHLRVASGVVALSSAALGSLVANRPDTPQGSVLADGQTDVIEDYRQERRFAVPPAYSAAGLASGLTVPMTDRSKVIGAL